jgi:hypothetical protein
MTFVKCDERTEFSMFRALLDLRSGRQSVCQENPAASLNGDLKRSENFLVRQGE